MTKDMLHESDEEMKVLFAAFDHVSASEDVKNRTLQAILEQGEQTGAAQSVRDEEAHEPRATEENEPSTNAVSDEQPADGGTGADEETSKRKEERVQVKMSKRSRWRVIRTTAIAACLALACFGGVAYATPAASIRIATDNGAVDLQVNRFGVTISANAESENAKKLVDEADPSNKNYEESIDSLLDALGDPGDHEATIDVESPDERMRTGIEEHGAKALEERGFGKPDEQLEPPSNPEPANEGDPQAGSMPAAEPSPDREQAPDEAMRSETAPNADAGAGFDPAGAGDGGGWGTTQDDMAEPGAPALPQNDAPQTEGFVPLGESQPNEFGGQSAPGAGQAPQEMPGAPQGMQP